jgi:ABC-type arginine transport system permease subunit
MDLTKASLAVTNRLKYLLCSTVLIALVLMQKVIHQMGAYANLTGEVFVYFQDVTGHHKNHALTWLL